MLSQKRIDINAISIGLGEIRVPDPQTGQENVQPNSAPAQ